MSKTIEEQVKEIRHNAECVVYSMKDHKAVWITDDGSLDEAINAMHIAKTKDKLSEAYTMYINACLYNGYPYAEIIGGIIQNKEQNEKFDVNIDAVIKSLLNIVSPIKLSEPMKKTNVIGTVSSAADLIKSKVVEKSEPASVVIEPNNVSDDCPAGGISIDEKLANKMRKKTYYINKVANEIANNQSVNPANDADKASGICDEINKFIASIDPEKCNKEEINELNDWTATINEMKKYFEACKTFYGYKPKQNEASVKQTTDTSQDKTDKNVVYTQQTTPVQATVAAHTENGFNISNFIKPDTIKGPNMPNDNKVQHNSGKPFAFPHQICGLTNDQIVAEVGKHFKVLEPLPAYPLYDLINNKLLLKRMKELDAKQRPNNPYLTQVNIHEYIGEPELLVKFQLCFTMPCNDKEYLIMVLFNPNPMPGKNGMPEYPIHIFKAKKTNNHK